MTRDEYGVAYQNDFIRTVRFLISRGVPPGTAPEVAQAAWAHGWEKREQLRSGEVVGRWVNSIAMNGYRQSLRRERLQEGITGECSVELNLASIDVDRLLGFCPIRDRMLLERKMEGGTTREMAREHGTTETAIRLRLLRARRRVRSILERPRCKNR